MTWTAPAVSWPPPPPFTADERSLLEGWLELHRTILRWKCSGLTADQLRQRAAPPSGMSLLGLVRHMTDVERGWFRRTGAGEDVTFRYEAEDDDELDWNGVDTADAAADLAAFDDEIEAARAAMTGHDLDEVVSGRDGYRDKNLRWIYVHMIEEYARHNGHADLLRERIDGATGDFPPDEGDA